MSFTEKRTSFQSNGVTCVANLYKPKHSSFPVPIIVLAHGIGAVKEMGLDAFAKRFAQANYAVFIFDYRFFGESGGAPRQVVDIPSQLEDWKNAIDHVRNLNDKTIDSTKIVLFGWSLSGGHVIKLSAECDVYAGIAQSPLTSGLASGLSLGVVSTAKIAPFVILDTIKLFVSPGSKATLVQLTNKPGSAALMPVADFATYLLLVPLNSTWRHSVGARIAFWLPFYNPGAYAKTSRCPLYMSICSQDAVAPASTTLKYAKGRNNVEYKMYNCGHFDMFVGPYFEDAVVDYIRFLNKVTHVLQTY